MKVLLLNPPYIKKNKIFMKEIGRCGSTASGNQFWPQTGLAYLAAVALKNHNVKIIDAIAEKFSFENILKGSLEFKPDIVIIHTTTPTFNNDVQVLKSLKKKINAKYGFVGNHVSNTVKDTLNNSPIDFVIVNEPETTFEELLNKFNKNWNSIKGLAYKQGSKIIINSLRHLSNNLDELPFPARHLLPNNKYRMVLTNNEPFATVVPSRGCPHQCIYCRVGYPWGKKFRKRTVDNVFLELKEIKEKYNVNNIVFMADTFTLDKKWVIDLCRKIINENLSLKWMCNSRIDTLDEEMTAIMKEAGCTLISFGVESGSQEVLKLAKKNVDMSKARLAISITKKAGINAFAYFIIGLPGETKETINKTVNLAKSLNADYTNFHIATPHPGTELEQIAKKNGWITDSNFDHYDQSGDYSVMRNESLTAGQILTAQKQAMKSYYLRPTIIYQQFKKIKTIADLFDMIKIGKKILFNS